MDGCCKFKFLSSLWDSTCRYMYKIIAMEAGLKVTRVLNKTSLCSETWVARGMRTGIEPGVQ